MIKYKTTETLTEARAMIVGKPLPFVNDYVNNLSDIISLHQINVAMTYGRKKWLAFCLTCIIV